jgi:cephalosporin-C deacetylase-like acetyl esterase
MLDPSTFAYDQQAPLALEVLSERVQDGAIVRDITYASPYGGKVPAYLILPSQQPQAGLIFGHWGEGNRAEFVDEAIVLTHLGFASLCLDAPHRRPAEYDPQRTQPQTELQWIADVRRGVDLLLQTFSRLPEHIGYVGHSYGATFGGVVAGVEHRISAFVLMAGWYALSELARTSTVPVLAEARSKIPPEVFAIYMDTMAPLDARHYIGHAAPSHLFFQFASNDTSVMAEDGECYFELASEPKQIAWYDNCNHELSTKARLERVNWLCTEFGLPQPSQEILNLLEQVPSPVPLES